MDAPRPEFYPREELWVFFDLTDHKAARSLELQSNALRENARIEFIGTRHVVLMARPGGARRLTS